MALYQRFFGFRKAPFELVPDPDFLYLGESHDSALANLIAGIEAGKGFVAITGPIGAGKTTILRALLRRIGRTDRLCFLSQPETSVADLLAAILDGFGAPAEGASLVELRRRIREFLAASERPGILILDEAHLLREEALEQIRLLSNLEDDHRKLLQIVLSGQPELKVLLSTPRLMPLAQRIEMFYEICPLSLEETQAYLARRLQIAAGDPGAEFDRAAATQIHACTGGIPRLINLLAERSLLSAYVAESRIITPEIVADAYEDLGEVTQAVMPGKPSRAVSKRRAKSKTSAFSQPETAEVGAEPTSPGRSRRPMRLLAGVGLAAILVLALSSLGSRPGRDASRAAAADSTVATLPASEPARPATAGISTVAPSNPVSQMAKPSAPAQSVTKPPTSESVGKPSAPAQSVTSPSSPGESLAKPAPASEEETAPPPATATTGPEKWSLHVASLQRLDAAQSLGAKLRAETGLPIRITPTELGSGVWYRVLLGDYASADAARTALESLRSKQDFAFVRTVRLSPIAPAEETP